MIVQLFRISDAIWRGLSREEIVATFKDMETLGIAEPPYKQFTIEMLGKSVFNIAHDFGDAERAKGLLHEPVQFHYDFDKDTIRVSLPGTGYILNPIPDLIAALEKCAPEAKYRERMTGLGGAIARALIVLLATKNVVKTTTKNPLAKHGLGKQRALYCTSLSIGKITESEPNTDPKHEGSPKRPHLRRGHIRNQRHGPNYEFTKQIFIQPCFVNADESFISTRTAYNVSLGGEPPQTKEK